MAGATHGSNVVVNVYLDPSPARQAGFSVLMLLVPLASNSLNGNRVMEFASYEEAQTARTASYISASTLLAAEVAFSQRPKPTALKVGYVDLVGSETYATGLTAVIAADADFYGLAITPRTDTEIALVGAAVEALSKKILFGFQGDDSSWLNAGIPSGLSAMAAYERSVPHYHDSDAEWMDVGNLVNRLVYDPDVQSAPWSGHQVRGVDAYTTGLTETQRTAALANNANLGLPYGGQDFVIDKGVNMAGRPVDEIITSDWFSTRLQERTAALVVEHANRGEKITVSKAGQKKILAVVEALLATGVSVGHFVDGQTEVVAETITSTDRTNRQLRFTVRAQLASSGRLFTFNCYFSRSSALADA